MDGSYSFDDLAEETAHWIEATLEGYRIDAKGGGSPSATPDATLDFVATPVITVPVDVAGGDPAKTIWIMVTRPHSSGFVSNSL